MSAEPWGAGGSPGVAAHRSWGTPGFGAARDRGWSWKEKPAPFPAAHHLEVLSWSWPHRAAGGVPGTQHRLARVQLLPSGTSSLSPREGPQLSVPAPSPGGQQTPPGYPGHIQLPLPFRCSQPLLPSPSSPHSPEPEELFGERPFPFASNFPRVGTEPGGSFSHPPPSASPLLCPGLAPREHNNKKCVGAVGKERCSWMVCSPDSTGSALKGNFILQ